MISIKPSELREAYDAIVIGAGVGGLVGAGFLARGGLSVLLLDHHYLPGGYCTAFPRKNLRFDAAVHHIGGCGRYGAVGQIVKRFGIDQEFVRLDPMDHLLFEDEEIAIPADIDAYEELLARRFPMEAERIRQFFKDLVRFHRQILRRKGDLLERWAHASFQEFLESYFEDPGLMRILGGQWGYLGLPVPEVSVIAKVQMLVSYLRDGAWYPMGSTQSFSDALARSILDVGGHVLLKNKVSEVLVDGGRAAGVRLENGRAVRAQLVVSNADARQLFQDLLPEEVCQEERSRLQLLKPSSSYFGLYLAFDRDADLDSLPRGFYYPTAADCEGAVEWMYLSITTRYDPSLAKDGSHILSATVGVRTDSPAYDRWQQDKSDLIRVLVRYLERRCPGLSGRTVHEEAATPRTLMRYTLARDGVAYGWAVQPDQTGEDRLPPQTTLPGLFLAGHWTTPGPGVAAVAASGWSTANRILEGTSP